MHNSSKHNELRRTVITGLTKGWDGYIWMLKIIVPISLFTSILQWSGLLEKAHGVIEPAMNILNLPAAAALPLIIGAFAGIYGGVAAMAVLPLTIDEMTLIAIFLLIAHNLIQEGAIQGKSGLHPIKATAFRLVIAILTVLIVGHFLQKPQHAEQVLVATPIRHESFVAMLREWGFITLGLVIKIFFIIMFILTLLEIMKSRGWITVIIRWMSPLLRAMGLSQRVGILWMTAVVFGLTYGGAVIVEETRHEELTRNELEELHLSIGINHSMIEDPSLFLPLGLSPLWLWVPRLLVAVIAVRLLTAWFIIRDRFFAGKVLTNPSSIISREKENEQ
ncbi:MAG: nucleoside recognition domain-containing protein [Deltaproteobacteria bacterium]|nr:nucleoside recognition domain-containing protein [Deltaproteobacteria bacterium]MBN2688533.1 nucleoside recognition domain-containing protein [Deltaproteobacteria bacterium]